ncbi:class I SAM-dependent methyltransferase [Denitrobaculum tricleocarpae]|uniref:SAM-dependent methyltransferase n=1 Tax=Denitrobaculum tricleocarpae TaxID=2591009 RepID=A0A545TT33_9PROT|nr:class I SAM-dependent methyltransferase [Denitrobaculum tricleocarpae]TQV80372.1 SAM-dependent methyltransferase [Denitrobaculum tricleocarpae]
MSTRSIGLDDDLYNYLIRVSLREPDLFARLRRETEGMPEAMMQISPEQGQFMQLLVKLTGAKNALEIGTFTGYSALAVATELPENGKLIACDISESFTSVGRPYWEEAGVADKIDLRIGPAVATLDALIVDGQETGFDFAFIDADKTNYANYYERCLKLLRPGGLIAIDNVLWDGSVVSPKDISADTQAIRALNDALKNDERIDLSLVPIGDGLTLARKRP